MMDGPPHIAPPQSERAIVSSAPSFWRVVAILGVVVVCAGAAALPLIVPDRTRSSASTEARSGNVQSSAAPFVSGPQATITCPAGAMTSHQARTSRLLSTDILPARRFV